MPTHFSSVEEMTGRVGTHLGHSEWHEVTAERVRLFSEATGDHQWIHVDAERAARESPFGGPVAHGYLTLSLAPVLLGEIYTVSGVTMGVNYGCNRVRFPSPVPVGSRLRLGAVLQSVEEIGGGVQVVLELTFEVEGRDKPPCVAEVVYRFYR